MVRQFLVIMKKEWVEVKTTFFSTRNLMAGIFPVVFICGAVSVYEPARIGLEWLQSPIMAFFLALLVPLTVIGFVSPDSFVGERRRGTLEPLLATPVSDQAILFGKIGMSGVFGWGMMLVSMFLGLVTVNLSFAQGRLLLYSPDIAIVVIVSGCLFSFLLAIGGVSCSLYATSLLEAQNKLGQILFVPIVFAAMLVSPYMPEWWRAMVVQMVANIGAASLVQFLIVGLFLVDIASMVIVMVQFNRKRLIF